jgi:sortase A
MPKGGLLFWAGGVLILGGAALLAVHCYDSLHSMKAQKEARQWLNRAASPRPTPPPQEAPSAARPGVHRGDVLGELAIPRLHMSVMVFEGDDAGILKIGAGHVPGTALPLGDGNIGIAAHRDTFFRPLRGIRASDVITLQTPTGGARFAVTETEIVRPSYVRALDRAPGRDLTLVTCYPFSYIGHAPRRFIVHAKRIG